MFDKLLTIRNLIPSIIMGIPLPGLSLDQLDSFQVDSPEISRAKRGSIMGGLSRLGEDSLNLVTGSFSVPLPVSFPKTRGKMAHPYSVSYSPGFGMSEYGIGWSHNLAIVRSERSWQSKFHR